MKISEIKYTRFSGTLIRPIRSSRKLIKQKPGFIIRLKSSEGVYGYGEAAPLAGFSNDTIEDISAALQNISSAINKNTAVTSSDMFKMYDNYPSLMFGMEQALHQITIQENEIEIKPKKIPVNYLIGSAELDEMIEIASMAYTSGWRTLKMKLGVKPFEAELETIENIQSLLPDITFRFDLNGAWSISEAERCINILSKYNVEYIEQPVEGLNSLLELSANINIPVAPDESIKTLTDAESAISHSKINYIVIKPMNFGFNNTIRLIEKANRLNKNIIISTLFEGFVGLTGVLYLASLVNHSKCHGINNYLVTDYFKRTSEIEIQNGHVEFSRSLFNFTGMTKSFG